MRRALQLVLIVGALAALAWPAWRLYGPGPATFRHPGLGPCRQFSPVDRTAIITGIEDMARYKEGTILSAHNRRLAAKTGKGLGGLYWLADAQLLSPTPKVVALVTGINPHGIHLSTLGAEVYLTALLRDYRRPALSVRIATYRLDGLLASEIAEGRAQTGLCTANDLIRTGPDGLVVSLDRAHCAGPRRLLENLANAPSGRLLVTGGGSSFQIPGLAFPNGLALSDRAETIFVAETRRHRVRPVALDRQSPRPDRGIALPFAPDNLSRTDNWLIAAGHPNLIRFAAYRAGWIGVGQAPSAIARIEATTEAVELLYREAGSLLSGSTVALLTDKHLIAGAAYDDGLLVCDAERLR